MITITIRKASGEHIILGTDGEKVIAKALECYIDHRTTGKDEFDARQILEHLKGVVKAPK